MMLVFSAVPSSRLAIFGLLLACLCTALRSCTCFPHGAASVPAARGVSGITCQPYCTLLAASPQARSNAHTGRAVVECGNHRNAAAIGSVVSLCKNSWAAFGLSACVGFVAYGAACSDDRTRRQSYAPFALVGSKTMTSKSKLSWQRTQRVAQLASKNPLRLPAENPYDAIGVPRNSEKSEVRKRFRKLVQTEHPDVKKDDPEATAKFQDLVSAYNAIMGDEILPDEMMYVRIYNTPRYQKALKKQVNIKSGVFYALLPGIVIGVLAVTYLVSEALGVADPETKRMVQLVFGGKT